MHCSNMSDRDTSKLVYVAIGVKHTYTLRTSRLHGILSSIFSRGVIQTGLYATILLVPMQPLAFKYAHVAYAAVSYSPVIWIV